MNPARTQLASFVVDPARDGVTNALWLAVSGTLALSAATPKQFKFNAAEGLVRADIKFGRVEFSVSYPLTGSQTPTTLASDISFGLKNLSLNGKGSVIVNANHLTGNMELIVSDRYGNTQTIAIPWRIAFNAAKKLFVIDWFDGKPLAKLSIAVPGPVTELTYTGRANGPFKQGKTVTGGTSGAIGTVISDAGGVLKVTVVSGTFQAETVTETETDGTPAVTAAVNGVGTQVSYEEIGRAAAQFVPTVPLNPFVKNPGAVDFLADYIVVDNSNQNSIMLI